MNALYMREGKRYWVRRCRWGDRIIPLLEVSHYQDREMKRPMYRCTTWLKKAKKFGGGDLR